MVLNARMLARVALAGGHRDRAHAEIGRALGVIDNADAPLGAWRAHATAAEISELRGESAEAARRWTASAETLRQLARSSADYPALGRYLLASPAARLVLERADQSAPRAGGSDLRDG